MNQRASTAQRRKLWDSPKHKERRSKLLNGRKKLKQLERALKRAVSNRKSAAITRLRRAIKVLNKQLNVHRAFFGFKVVPISTKPSSPPRYSREGTRPTPGRDGPLRGSLQHVMGKLKALRKEYNASIRFGPDMRPYGEADKLKEQMVALNKKANGLRLQLGFPVQRIYFKLNPFDIKKLASMGPDWNEDGNINNPPANFGRQRRRCRYRDAIALHTQQVYESVVGTVNQYVPKIVSSLYEKHPERTLEWYRDHPRVPIPDHLLPRQHNKYPEVPGYGQTADWVLRKTPGDTPGERLQSVVDLYQKFRPREAERSQWAAIHPKPVNHPISGFTGYQYRNWYDMADVEPALPYEPEQPVEGEDPGPPITPKPSFVPPKWLTPTNEFHNPLPYWNATDKELRDWYKVGPEADLTSLRKFNQTLLKDQNTLMGDPDPGFDKPDPLPPHALSQLSKTIHSWSKQQWTRAVNYIADNYGDLIMAGLAHTHDIMDLLHAYVRMFGGKGQPVHLEL